jgi:hypothetical protein
MYGAWDYLAGLSQLHELDNAEERRASWRQGLASLAAATESNRLAPLEGVLPDCLLASVRLALATGLVDDLGWLPSGVAGAALFELAAALPAGPEKRDLGRRVLAALHTGDLPNFVRLATSLASTSPRALGSVAARARIAVAVRLPIGMGADVDRLALALLAHPELEKLWLGAPTTGPLRTRRVAARLLERAAREAARLSEGGDDAGLKVLSRPSVRTAWARLLGDRESLIWRHAATARGLLAAADKRLADDVERDLDPRVGPAAWRRAVTSLAASIGRDPAGVTARCQELVEGPLFTRDPSLAAAMIFGLSRAATVEPEAVEALLPLLVEAGDLEAVEALVDLLREHRGRRLGGEAVTVATARLRTAATAGDDGLAALRRALDADLAPLGGVRQPSLGQHLDAGVLAFAEGREVRPHAEAALEAADLALGVLERSDEESSEGRQGAFQALLSLDRGLLETALLADLLTISGLDPRSTEPGDLGDLLARFSVWLAAREGAPAPPGPVPHVVLRTRRLRALLHAADGEGGGDDAVPEPVRARRFALLRTLIARAAAEEAEPLRPLVCAALARTCDGLVRDGLCEISDVLVAISGSVTRADALRALADTAVTPELRNLFGALAALAARIASAADDDPAALPAMLEALAAVTDMLPMGLSARIEGLRRALVAITGALERILEAPSLAAVKEGQPPPIDQLEEAIRHAAELRFGVRRRLGGANGPATPLPLRAFRALDRAIDRVAQGGAVDLQRAVLASGNAARAALPAGLAEPVVRVLARIAALPTSAGGDAAGPAEVPAGLRLRLPSWLPPSRTLGGFYVLRPIGSGQTGSVFVVRRAEERHDEGAELFALKVPSFDGSVAHTLSEDEFLRLFREEAGALLTLPAHANLAGFVTFDARARPKPLLVMELVPGPTLERAVERRRLSATDAFAVLDGIAAGLEAMHAIGIGHLDVKPANVILRPQTGPDLEAGGLAAPPVPVLVDFGLAGRKVRPGCASPYYGAPEVWDTQGLGPAAEPTAADVYSFCCLAYELLTGARLFTGDTLPALLAAHFGHTGNPPGLERLREDPRLAPLAEILSLGLAPEPRARFPIGDLRSELARVAPTLRDVPWPLAA